MEIVLVHPDISHNTGRAARLAAATGTRLHLVEPLGFKLEARYLKRAGLDYWPRLAVAEHRSWRAYREATAVPDARLWLFSTRARQCVFDVEFSPGDHFVFGKETGGLPAHLLESMPTQQVGFPLAAGERSMNVATIVCAAVYEGIRQLSIRKLIGFDDQLRNKALPYSVSGAM